MSILDSIDSPADLKRLDAKGLRSLAEEIRGRIVATVSRNGGHLASNLGVVELTLALHRVFDSPKDAIVWDVGHQCYAHKLLTGRRDCFEGLRKAGGLSGFPKRSESCHDHFDTGHASTSISSALGLLAARSLQDEPGKVIAVIGDGALTGGMAFEALSHAGQLGLPLVVVLNDNKMSISPNVGALSRYLSRLSTTVRYQNFRSRVDALVRRIPLFGPWLYPLMVRGKSAVKALFFKENLFADLGFEYVGPIDGHNLPAMIQVFRELRSLKRPVVVHVLTRKGKGYELAEEDPARYHGVSPMRVSDGKIEARPAETFTEAFSASLIARGYADSRVVAVTAAMAKGTGLEEFRAACPGRLYDVGIAEEHAVTFAAGLATGGMRPVVAIYSTFMQRAVDQVFHDVALPRLPVTFVLDRAGAVEGDGETHQGIYDLALFRSMPNMTIIAPSDARELDMALAYGLASDGPTMVRIPKARCPAEEPAAAEPLVAGRGVFLRRAGAETLVVALGGLVPIAVEASDALLREGRSADVYSLRFAAPIDEEAFLDVAAPYRRILFLEEGVSSGGLGEALAALAARRLPRLSFAALGFPAEPFAQGTRAELLEMAGLSAAAVAERLRRDEAEAARIFLFRASGNRE
ncbi:MAG: 1-deoxy-D-xylulose-5-phosphate synthase [Spirochaetaceae bacterium]|nr:1-deoxy-D-xylulose-5-phosphate synthase [Spirochaetaceae bacterium]